MDHAESQQAAGEEGHRAAQGSLCGVRPTLRKRSGVLALHRQEQAEAERLLRKKVA